ILAGFAVKYQSVILTNPDFRQEDNLVILANAVSSWRMPCHPGECRVILANARNKKTLIQ
ncbi:MAG: hypothetical protein Q8L38_05640, partial [Pseudohongiella sp.]|nr:hypothetical protein [Pseudohongiella sp.]